MRHLCRIYEDFECMNKLEYFFHLPRCQCAEEQVASCFKAGKSQFICAIEILIDSMRASWKKAWFEEPLAGSKNVCIKLLLTPS
jgi:hypothetical protein